MDVIKTYIPKRFRNKKLVNTGSGSGSTTVINSGNDISPSSFVDSDTFYSMFELVDLSGTPAIKAKHEFFSVAGVTAYGTGTVATGGSGSSVYVLDVLNSTDTGSALSANMGRVLNEGKLNRSEISSWALGANKPTYGISEITGLSASLSGKSAVGHAHTISEISDFAHVHQWNAIENKPTTLSGYGITDALLKSDINVQVGGTKNSQMLWTSWGNSDAYGGAIQIREYGNVNNTQSDWYYSPAITFHWSNRSVKRFGMRSDGQLAIDNNVVWHSGNDGSGSGLDADLVRGLVVNTSANPFGRIPSIGYDGVMEIGGYIDMHYDNTGAFDYSIRLKCQGNYENSVNLPTTSGTLALLTDNIASATKLQTARTIAGVSFDGTANISIPFANLSSIPTTLSGYGITDAYTKSQVDSSLSGKVSKSGDTMTGNLTAPTFIGALHGNADTATKLATARTIAGTSFDGTANINISYNNLTNLPSLAFLPLAGGTMTGNLTMGATTDIITNFKTWTKDSSKSLKSFLDKFDIDTAGNLVVKTNLYSTGEVTAYSSGTGVSGLKLMGNLDANGKSITGASYIYTGNAYLGNVGINPSLQWTYEGDENTMAEYDVLTGEYFYAGNQVKYGYDRLEVVGQVKASEFKFGNYSFKQSANGLSICFNGVEQAYITNTGQYVNS